MVFGMIQIVSAAVPTLETIPSPQNLTEDVPYTYIVNASDPEAGDLTFSDNTDNFDIVAINGTHANISFTPTSAMVGTFTAVILIVDNEDNVVGQAVNFTVNGVPTMSLVNKNVTAGNQFEYDINASDPEYGVDEVNYTDDSALFVINLTTGLINFTTVLGDVGDYTINITINDSFDAQVSSTFNLAINDYPNASNIPNSTGIEDINVTINMSAYVNNTVGTLTFYDNSTNFDINPSTGLINFTPNSSMVGEHWINITVVDQYGLNASRTDWFLNISAANDAPTFDAILDQIIYAGLWFTYDVNATDEEGDAISYSDDSSYFDINSSGYINFLTNSSMIGTTTINITANDTNGNFTLDSFLLAIVANNAPVFSKNFTLNLTPISDAYVDSQFTTTNYGGSELLKISDLSTSIKRTYLNFSFDSLPSSAVVLIANLNLTVSASNVDENISLYIVNNSWGESTITYSDQPTINSSIQTNFTSVVAESDDSFNVLSEVNNWINSTYNGSGVSLRMLNESGDTGTISYYSSDSSNSSKWPTLYLTYNRTLPDQSLNQDTNLTNVFDLDDYFYDIDGHDLSFYVSGTPALINVSIDSNNNVTISAGSTAGNETIYFNGTDALNSTLSNGVVISLISTDLGGGGTSGSSGGGGGGSSSRTASLSVSLDSSRASLNIGDLLALPIVVENTGELSVQAINLRVGSDKPGLVLGLTNNLISTLGVGERSSLSLTIDSTASTAQTYVISLTASSNLPTVNASAVFILDVLDESETIEQDLILAQDLFEQNPECMELQELVVKAEQYLSQKNYEEAKNNIALAIEGCKNMIRAVSTPPKVTSGLSTMGLILIALTLITIIIIVSYALYVRFRFSKIK